jgi:hypothetical protein
MRYGTTAFLKLLSPEGVPAFLARLRRDYETVAVPGRFFEMPDHFRIGMGVDSAMFATGLENIGKALRSGERSQTAMAWRPPLL